MKRIVLALSLIAALTGSALAGTAEGMKGKLGHLAQYIGTPEYEAVLNDPVVRQNLEQAVGKANVKTVRDNLQVQGEVEYIEGHLVLSGNAPHMGDSEVASVWIKVHDGSVRVGLLHNGKTTVYAKDGQYQYVPSGLRDFAKRPTMNMETKPPQGVTWVR